MQSGIRCAQAWSPDQVTEGTVECLSPVILPAVHALYRCTSPCVTPGLGVPQFGWTAPLNAENVHRLHVFWFNGKCAFILEAIRRQRFISNMEKIHTYTLAHTLTMSLYDRNIATVWTKVTSLHRIIDKQQFSLTSPFVSFQYCNSAPVPRSSGLCIADKEAKRR